MHFHAPGKEGWGGGVPEASYSDEEQQLKEQMCQYHLPSQVQEPDDSIPLIAVMSQGSTHLVVGSVGFLEDLEGVCVGLCGHAAKLGAHHASIGAVVVDVGGWQPGGGLPRAVSLLDVPILRQFKEPSECGAFQGKSIIKSGVCFHMLAAVHRCEFGCGVGFNSRTIPPFYASFPSLPFKPREEQQEIKYACRYFLLLTRISLPP